MGKVAEFYIDVFVLDYPLETLKKNTDEIKTALSTIIMHRRISNLKSGSGVHLLALCSCLTESGFAIRLVMAPTISFGRIPFCKPDKELAARGIVIDWPGTMRIFGAYISIRPCVWGRSFQRLGFELRSWALRMAGAPPRSHPSDLGKTLRDNEAIDVVSTVNAREGQLVIAEYSSLAPLLGRCKTDNRAVLLHDLFASRTRAFEDARLEPDHHELSLEEECERLADADLLIHSSIVEQGVLEERLPKKRHIWMQPVLRRFQSVKGGPPRAVFLGAMHGGNREALDLILTKIWPKVQPRVEHELWIVGEISRAVIGKHEKVRCIPHLDDLSEIGGSNAIGIAPISVASGISIKIGTYLELGMRVLTFNATVEAYGDALDSLVTMVETPDEFADTLVTMLNCTQQPSAITNDQFSRLKSRLENSELLDYLSDLDVPSA